MPAAYQSVLKGSALILMILIDAVFIYSRIRRRAKAAKLAAKEAGRI